MARPIVQDDDVAGTQFRDENLFDIGLECVAIDRPTQYEGRDHAAQGEASDKGGGFPVAVREAHAQAFAAPAATMGAGHVGLRPVRRAYSAPLARRPLRTLDEDQPFGFKVALAVEPSLSPPQDVGAVLLRRVPSLFLRVRPWRRKNRRIVP